jgi:hypothetical protein
LPEELGRALEVIYIEEDSTLADLLDALLVLIQLDLDEAFVKRTSQVLARLVLDLL